LGKEERISYFLLEKDPIWLPKGRQREGLGMWLKWLPSKYKTLNSNPPPQEGEGT
jgi:hypothetical protein